MQNRELTVTYMADSIESAKEWGIIDLDGDEVIERDFKSLEEAIIRRDQIEAMD